MQQTDITADHASTLGVLVNTDRIRSSIKRLFHHRIDEVVSEIVQNCQRAGAKNVDIVTTENSFTIQDNGHGLLGGIDGFHTLLKLAESNFDNNTIEDQDPMGVGIVSLLTHDQISEVTFSSGTLELTLDTKKWWNEPDYYSVWYQRLTALDHPIAGLRISAKCAPELVSAIQLALQPKDVLYTYSDEIFKSASPAQGYEGILTITLNSKNVRTSLPAWTKLQDKLISTTYLGSKLTIGYNDSCRRSSILWYGQLISLRALNNSFDFHLEVVSGRPVNPLSPSRTGFIQDAAYYDLLAFIKEQIFDFIFDEKNRAKIKPAHVEACFRLDNARATTNCPYIVVEDIQTNESPNSLEDLNSSGDLNHPNTRTLFTYDDAPLLLNEGVSIQRSTKVEEALLRTAIPSPGDRARLYTAIWRPNQAEYRKSLVETRRRSPTQLVLQTRRLRHLLRGPPTEWMPITKTPVFAFTESSSYDACDVDFTVGTDDIMGFLDNQVWAGFSANDENDYDPQEESYHNSVSDIIRSIIGNCVPHDYTRCDLSRFLKDQTAPIIAVTSHPLGNWRARYKELAPGEAERLTTELGKYVPPWYVELGPHADAISIYHEAVHARRAMLGRTMTKEAAEPSAQRAERFAQTLENHACH
jgi:hypothetical protein